MWSIHNLCKNYDAFILNPQFLILTLVQQSDWMSVSTVNYSITARFGQTRAIGTTIFDGYFNFLKEQQNLLSLNVPICLVDDVYICFET